MKQIARRFSLTLKAQRTTVRTGASHLWRGRATNRSALRRLDFDARQRSLALQKKRRRPTGAKRGAPRPTGAKRGAPRPTPRHLPQKVDENRATFRTVRFVCPSTSLLHSADAECNVWPLLAALTKLVRSKNFSSFSGCRGAFAKAPRVPRHPFWFTAARIMSCLRSQRRWVRST